MASYFPKAVPTNWYRYDATFSFELLETYINILEEQVDESVRAFNEGKASVVVEENPTEGWAHVLEVYKSLDDGTWDLQGIFEDYFPNLQRGGGLVTLYSYLEHELNKLCDQFVVSERMGLQVKDVKGDGIDRAVLFLSKAVGLSIDKSNALWNDIVKIRKIRNLIVHNESKLSNQEQELVNYVNQHANLQAVDDEVRILNGYLVFVLGRFKELFDSIDKLIQQRAKVGPS